MKIMFDMNKYKFLLLLAAVVFMGCSPKNRSGQKAVEKENKESVATKTGEGGAVRYLTTADFKRFVMDYEAHPQEWVFQGKRPAVVDFYATWCGPCKMMAPVVEGLAKDYAGKVDFYKVDIDKEQDLASAFGIQSIPTFLFVPVDGNPTVQMGAMQREDFEKIIKTVLLK